MICDPAEQRSEPAVLVAVGNHSAGFSWSEKATSKGSIVPVLAVAASFIGSAPSAMTCLSTSDTKT